MARSVVIAALSFGLIMGASLLKLWDTGASVGGASDLAQWVEIGLLLTLTWLFPRHTPPAKRVAALGCVALAGVYLTEYLYLYVAPEAALFDGTLSVRTLFGVMQGISEAAFTIVCAYLFSALPPKHSSVAISLGIAVNMALLALQPLLVTPQITMLRNVLLATGAVFACAGVFLVSRGRPGTALAPGSAGTDPAAGTGADRRFGLFVGCATVLAFLFGFLRRYVLHYEAVTGSSSLVCQVVLLAVALALLAYACVRGITMRGDVVIYTLCPLFMGAYLIVALAPESGLFVADMLAGIGFTLLRLLMWTTMARIAYADPRRLGTYVAFVVLATALGPQVGFQAAQAVAESGADIPLGAMAATAVVLCIMCCLVMAPGYIRRQEADRLSMDAPGTSAAPSGAGAMPGSTDRPAQSGRLPLAEGHGGSEEGMRSGRVDAGSPEAGHASPATTDPTLSGSLARFVSYYGLSSRESQILVQATKGHTMAAIGEKMGLSGNTVRTYMRRVYTKTGVDSKQELISLIEEFEQLESA